ncbi:UDP-2,3-diacylglucosamine diphosphatase LpxI [uncultured Mailhella sp.]|uniref:LpxI family protein n=1 Tax=uncultured Mailhella sp. TaxID=1981031 RepID=UPI00261421BE|nr:UDP-2,3-diacylglucosamine diphosphatase LpxI [uncultured Mailhella sp.]
MKENIGIIAGGGQFPRLVAKDAHDAGMGVFICGFQGHTDPSTADSADVFQLLHLGQLNRMIQFFREHGVRRVCMAGSINKPRALEFRPDWRAAKIVLSLRSKGDDSLLRAIIAELEKDGLSVVSSADLAPGLRCPAGVLTRRAPSEEVWKDIRYAWPIARTMGSYDIGQCLVVRQGMVMAVECLEGSDAAIKRGAELGGEGCTAVKMVKPGQDERVDLPSIGLTTIRNLVSLRYAALAIHAGKTLFFDREEALALADENGLSIVALNDDFS